MDDLYAIIAKVGFMLAKSTGIYLSVWVIRYKADWDYKLSATAKWVRWAVVYGTYLLAASLPGNSLAAVRVIVAMTGLLFLCWPNCAYHLAKRFVAWPIAEGRVISSIDGASRWVVSYSFDVDGEMFGGIARVKPLPGLSVEEAYPRGASVAVRYDPLNATTESVLDPRQLLRSNVATHGH